MILEVWLASLAFALQHSLLATERVKSLAHHRWGIGARRYRLLYVLMSLLTTGLWLHQISRLPDVPVYQLDGIYSWLAVSLQLLGGYVIWLSLRPIDGLAFLGLRAGNNGPDGFVESGIYRIIRHPMYSGLLLVLVASAEQTAVSLNLTACVCCYFLAGSRMEEARLIHLHPGYINYRRRVPAFIPRWHST